MINTNYNTYNALNSYASSTGNMGNRTTNNTLSNTNDVAAVLTIRSQASGKAPVLKKGSRGTEVTNLQKNLTKLGYDTKGVDGVFGDNTEAAVRKFQKAHNLSVDGIVGDKTRQAIENALKGTKPSEILKKGSRGREVETLQKNLTKLGYNTKGTDGIFGDNTEAAVRRFQKAYGLSVDGIVGKDTSKAIERALKGEKPIKVLKKGNRGKEVEALQKNLIKLGYGLKKADGVFGNNTEKAVKEFQKAYGLSVDGIVGKDTSQMIERALKGEKPVKILKSGSKGTDVKILQKNLAKLGYDLKADGTFGKNTENAVKIFQKAHGLSVDGIVGKETSRAITNAVKEQNNSGILKLGSRGAEVKTLQKNLIKLGYNIKADGVYGKNTEAAVKKVQKAQAMMLTGAAGKELRKIIDKAVKEINDAIKKAEEKIAPAKAKQAMIDNIKNDKTLELSGEQKNELSQVAKRLLDEGYETAFVAGVLGNIMREGGCGHFENSNYKTNPEAEPDYLKIVDEHFDYRNKFSDKSICTIGIEKTKKLLNDIKNGGKETEDGGFGLGMVQWTFERTEKLIKYYKKYSNGDKPTKQECMKAELNLLSDELKGEFSSVYKEWKNGKKTAEKAGEVFFRRFEKAKERDGEAEERIKNAKNIYKIMMKKTGV